MSTVFGFTPKEAPSPMDLEATAKYNKQQEEEKERLKKLRELREKYNNPVLGMDQKEAMEYVTAMGSTDSIRGLGQIFAKATGWDSLDKNLKKKDKKLHAIFQNEKYGGKAFAAFLGSAIALDPVSYVPVAGWAKKAKNIKTLGEFTKYGAKSSAILGGISYTSEDIPGLITEADDGFLKKKAEQVGLSTVAGGALTGTLGTASNIFAKVVGNEAPFPVSSFWSKETGAETTSGQKIKNNFENPEKRTPKILQDLNTNYQKYVGEPAWKAIQANPAEFLGGSTGAIIGYGTSGSVIDEETRTVDVEATQKQRLTRTALFAALGAGVPYALKQNDAIRETVGRLVINDYGLSAERIAARQDFTITKNSIADEFGDLTSRVANDLDVEQRKLLYGLMTGEIKTLDKSLDLPVKKQIESFNKEGRDLINKYAKEFRDAGMLDPEVFKKNINTYLRRSYLKQSKLKDTDTRLYEINKDIRVIGDEFKPRGIFDEVNPKDFNNKNGVWQQEGWEKVDTLSNGKFKVRRDLTKEERVDLEEIEDAAYAIAETGRLFANDIATMRFFDDLSKDSKYVLSTEDYSKLSNKEKKKFTIVSKDTIKDTDVQKFGNLSGKYVDKSVFKDVEHIFKIGTQEDFYRQQGIKQAIQLQQLWKKMKTSYNPGTHVANTMSNVMLLDVAAGTDFKYVIKAMKEMRKGNDSKIYRQAKVDGFMDSNLVSKELNEYGSQIERNLVELQGNLGHVESGIWGYTKNALKYVKKQTADRAEKLYSLEDSVFRMAVYMDRLDKGASRVDATLDARKLFVDYDINAPLIKGLKNTAVPFISYTYRIVPILAEAAVKNPVKYAKWAGIAWAADEIGKEATDDTGEVNKLTMQKYNNQKMFGLPFMPSTNIRLPFNDERGQAMYINMARWIPGGDIFEQKSGEGSQLPFLPQPLQPGGFYVDAWTNFYNKIDPFTGKKIEGNTLTHFLKRQPPNIPFLSIPYVGDTFATEKIKKASRADTTSLTNKLVYQYGEQFGTAPSPYSPQMSPWVAIAQGLGIKLNPQDKEINKAAKENDFNRQYNQLNSEINKAYTDWERQKISFEEYEKIEKNNTEEIIKISAEYDLLTEKISVAESKETQSDYIKKYYPFYGRLNKFEGGEVDVPYTKDEPEDRVDSFTGKPYSDQMVRLGFNEGGSLFSNVINNIREKIPAEARLYFDKVIKQNKEPINKKDFTEKEYNNIKNHFKQTLINDIKSGKLTFDKKGNAQYIRQNKKGDNFTKPFISGYTPVNREPTKLETAMGIEPKPSDGSVKDFTNVFGDASYSFKKDNYENAVGSINDVYDFNFEYGGGFNSDIKYKRGSNINFTNSEVRLLKDTEEKAGILNPINRAKYISSFKSIKPREVLRGNLNTLRPIAERYAAFKLPDEKTAKKLEKKYSPVNVKVDIPMKDIFTKEEYNSLFTENNNDQMSRLGLQDGGVPIEEPRAIKNNNPLNMSLGSVDKETNSFMPYNGVAKYSGVVGIDKENLGGLRKDGVTEQLETFAKFEDFESGARANFMNLNKNYNGLTLGEIVQKFSRTDKDTYAQNVSKFSNVPVDKIIDFENDEETAIKVFKGMHRLEAGKHDERATDETLSKAWKDSKISKPDSEYSKTQWNLDKNEIAKKLSEKLFKD